MAQEKLVRLYTERGWSTYVRLDDPLFSDILAPYIDLDEDVTEVKLMGSVATAMEQEYDSVEKLLELMERTSNAWWLLLNPHKEEELELGEKTLNLIKEAGITLDKIRTLSRILNLPTGWEFHVGVLPGDVDYIHHLRQLTEVSPRRGIRIAGFSFSSFAHVTQASTSTKQVASLTAGMSELPSYLVYNNELAVKYHTSRFAAIGNMYITNYKLPDTLYGFDWDGMSELIRVELNEAGASLPLNFINGYATYHGHGRYDMPIQNTYPFALRASKTNSKRGHSHLGIVYSPPITTYYSIALSSFPDDIDPVVLGLGFLLSPRTIKSTYVGGNSDIRDGPANLFMAIATWVNQNLSLIAYENAKAYIYPSAKAEKQSEKVRKKRAGETTTKVEIPPDIQKEIDERQVVLFLEYAKKHIAGEEGLRRIHLSILHEMLRLREGHPLMPRLTFIEQELSGGVLGPDVPKGSFPNYI